MHPKDSKVKLRSTFKSNILQHFFVLILIIASIILVPTVKAEGVPDLVIDDITWNPVDPKTGDTVTFTVNYKNNGDLNTGNGFYISLYIDDERVDYKSVDDLQAGASIKTTFTWDVDRDISGGDHSVTAYIDMANSEANYNCINESSESNNDLTKNFQITSQQPDLVIDDITWNPVDPKTGDTVTFTVDYKNNGDLNTGNGFGICLYVDEEHVDYKTVSDLQAGATAKTTFTWDVDRDISGGDHLVTAYIDMSNSEGNSNWISESSESNNGLTKNVQVTSQQSDLVIENITWNPVDPKTGDTVTFTVDYKNNGDLNTGNGFGICLYVDEERVDYKTVSDLQAGATAKTTFTWDVDRDISGGDHSVTVYIDMSNSEGNSNWISESSESNNDLTKNFQITSQQPDLVIDDITWNPVDPKTGDTVTFTVDYKNNGELNTGNGFGICLYVDEERVDYKSVDDLQAGATAKTTFTWDVDRDISGGDHSVTAYIDMSNSEGNSNWISESSESNNDLTKNVQVTSQQSDLVIENITWNPVDPKTGDTVTFTVNYKNEGMLNTGNGFYICLYVDEERVDYKSVDDLQAGATAKTTFTWDVDREISSGDHSVTAYIDMFNKEGDWASVCEISEYNNKKDVNLIIAKIYSYTYLTVHVTDDSNSINLEDSDVYLDNEFMGKTNSDGILTKEIVEGEEHLLRVTKTDYDEKVQTFKTGYDIEKKEITVYLTYAKTPISITVEDEHGNPVSNAEVFLDNNHIGITDIDGEITFETKKDVDSMLKVTKNGYYEENSMVHIGSYKSHFYIELKLDDKIAPSITIDSFEIVGDDDEILEEGESFKFTYSVKDNTGIGTITCKLDGKIIDSYSKAGTYSELITFLDVGNHVLQIEAMDNDISAHNTSKEIPIVVSKRGPYVGFKCTKNSINVGEKAIFTLDAVNPVGNSKMAVQLIIETPSGVSVTGSSFAKSGAGTYTASYEIDPGDDSKIMTIDVQGNEVGKYVIKAEVHYSIRGENAVIQKKELTLEVIDPKITDSESGLVKSAPGFEVVFALLGLLSIKYILGKKH